MDLPSFIAGVAATIVGFLLTMAWDIYKTNRDTTRRQRAVLATIREEITANIDRLTGNQTYFKQEIALIDTHNQLLLAPAAPLETTSWALVRIDTPANSPPLSASPRYANSPT